MKNGLFKKHYSQLCFEAGLRSALLGISLSFAVTFVLSALEWLLDFGATWISVVVFVSVSAIAGALLYMFKFRPSDKDVARRLDRLGLDERMITMLEYEADDSYIATLQRENAKVHFKSVEDRKFKLQISAALIAIVVVTAIVGSSMTTVLALAENGILPSGSDIISGDEFLDYIPVSYIVDEGGYITGGEADQLVAPGEDADPVVAEAEDGWVFIGWDDESTNPARHDKNITEPREYIAIFEPIDEEEDGEETDGEGGEDSDEGDQSSDQPSEEDSTSSEGQKEEQNQESQDGQPGDDESENEESESTDDSESDSGNNGQGSGGKWEETNMFYDGQTYYKDAMDYYENYYEDDSSIPPELREFFELYFGSL